MGSVEYNIVNKGCTFVIKLRRNQGDSPNRWYEGTLLLKEDCTLEAQGDLEIEIISNSAVGQPCIFTGADPKVEVQKTIFEGRSITWGGYSPIIKDDGTPTEAAILYNHEGGWPERTFTSQDTGIYTTDTSYIHTDIKIEENNKIYFAYQLAGYDSDYSAEALIKLTFACN